MLFKYKVFDLQSVYFSFPKPQTFFCMEKSQLAGVGNRLVAQIIDGIIICIAFTVLLVPFGGIATLIGLNANNLDDSDAAAAMAGFAGLGFLTFGLFTLVGPLLYESLMLSSSKQATLGKIIMKIKVVNETSERLSFGQALGRSLIKYVSFNVCFLLWLWPLFNPQEQSLHDLVIKGYVLRSN